MPAADLPGCEAIAKAIHVAHPEDAGRMGERLRLFPAGCRVLRRGGRIVGYGVSHPWTARDAPALNTPLARLPARADALLIHDLALLPEARGRGEARGFVAAAAAIAVARGFGIVSLVAVSGAAGFWAEMGFRVVAVPALGAVLRSYDAEACYMERDPASDAGGCSS